MNNAHKLAAVLAACFTIALFAAVGLVTINALSTAENGAATRKIKFFKTKDGAGAGGYDVVSYFNEARAAPGKAEYETEWGGAVWRFSTPENRELFRANPAAYIPQYGGHCAYGASQNYLVRGDPKAWSVRKGKLYLNYNANIRTAWLASADDFVRDADANWAQLNN